MFSDLHTTEYTDDEAAEKELWGTCDYSNASAAVELEGLQREREAGWLLTTFMEFAVMLLFYLALFVRLEKVATQQHLWQHDQCVTIDWILLLKKNNIFLKYNNVTNEGR